METHFDEELKILRQKLLQMGSFAEEMIGQAVTALKERDSQLTEAVFATEDKVNRMEVEIEDDVLVLLARRQPAAKDLRFLTAILKINNDLERVADQAVNIAELTLYLLKEPLLKPLIDIPLMAALARRMVRNSLQAFIYHDTLLAKDVCERDDEVDRLNDQIFRELLTYMMENPRSITRAVDLILISRNLERIADHATNIGEEVIFIEQGKNIKHHLLENSEASSKVL